MRSGEEKLIKKPSDERDFTDEQYEEWIKCALDKQYFFQKYVYIQSETGRSTFEPRSYQERMIEACEDNRMVVCVAGRQCGKTTMLGMDVLHDIIFTRDYAVGISSYKQKNVDDFINRIKFAYENLPWWLKPACTIYNSTTIRFTNSSSVYIGVTNETFGRGMTLKRIILDELAFVDAKISDALMASLLPSISAAGENSTTRLNIISTPNGTTGSFYNIWSKAITSSNSFHPVEIKYEEIPGRTAEFEAAMIRDIGRDMFDQEFRNAFISSSGTLVNSRKLESIIPTPIVEQYGDLDIYTESFAGRTIALACDLSEGVGQDYSTIQIFDINTFEQLAEYANNTVNQTNFVLALVRIMRMLKERGCGEIYWTFEANSIGVGVARLVENVTDPILLEEAILISDDGGMKRLGMQTTSKTKKEGCAKLKDLIEMDHLHIKSQKLINELKVFIAKGASFEAQPGCHDDRVMSTVLMVNLLNELVNYEDRVETVMNNVELNGDDDWSFILF